MITADEIYQRAILLQQSGQEIEQREYIKTSYYAVFHKIQEVCDKNNITRTARLNSGTHEHIIDRININHSGKMIALNAKRMKNLRIKADYFLNEDILPTDIHTQTKWLNECWYRLSNFAS